jgi:hypothetical protein
MHFGLFQACGVELAQLFFVAIWYGISFMDLTYD